MKKDITSKLHKLVNSQEEFNEIKTTYFFVEIRKILEKDNSFQEFPLIKFYGDWVLHSYLDQRPSQEYLGKIQSIFTGDREHDSAVHVSEEIRPFINFNELKEEFRSFIQEELGESDALIFLSAWSPFLNSLINIIIDSPLKMKNSSSVIEELSFKQQFAPGDVILELKLRNGITHYVSMNFPYLDL